VLVEIETRLRARQERRDRVHDRARNLRRAAQETMRRLHAAGPDLPDTERLGAEVRAFAEELHGELYEEAPLANDALQEGAEALLLDAVVRGRPLPGPNELGLSPEPYLLGLGDLVGEVRRLVLRDLSDARLGPAEERLALMEELYHVLMRFEAPRSVVTLKPKQDAARALIERTRGDMTMARMLRRAERSAAGEGSGR
jgi:translin